MKDFNLSISMRQTYYQAYQTVLESEESRHNKGTRKRISKVSDVSNEQVKSYFPKRSAGDLNTPERGVNSFRDYPEAKRSLTIPYQYQYKEAPELFDNNAIARNKKYRGMSYSPFYHEKSNECTPKSGIFSTDTVSVMSALDNGVPTNKPVNSKLISDENNFGDNMHIGMVDALTYQCYNGNDHNVLTILKHGYKPLKHYRGFTPITAAIAGRNIYVLKLLLSIPKLCELVNEKDGFGNYPLEAVAKEVGTDLFEFAKVLIEHGARDDNRDDTDKAYSAAMLVIMNRHPSPNLFGELLPVTDFSRKTYEGLTLLDIARKCEQPDYVRMLEYFSKYGEESINQSITHSRIIRL